MKQGGQPLILFQQLILLLLQIIALAYLEEQPNS